MNISFTVEEPYYWDTMRPLYRYLVSQGFKITIFCLKHHVPQLAVPDDGMHEFFAFKRLESKHYPTLLVPPYNIDINFFGNYMRVKGAVNFFLNHGTGLKSLTSMIMCPGPHLRMIRHKFRYEMLATAKKYGTLMYYNIGGVQPLQFFDSDKIGLFFAGNYLKLDEYYQNLLTPAPWYEEAGDKPKVLFAPTLSVTEQFDEVTNAVKKTGVSTMVKAHYFDRRIITAKNENMIYNGEILPAILAADIVVSDISSVLYEAALIGKKVVRLNDRDHLHRNVNKLGKSFNFGMAVNLTEARFMAPLWNEMNSADYVNCDIESLRYPDHEFLCEQFPNQSGTIAENLFKYAKNALEQGQFITT